MEEKLMLMMNTYQQDLANEQARRIQAEADLQIARNEINNLQGQLAEQAKSSEEADEAK